MVLVNVMSWSMLLLSALSLLFFADFVVVVFVVFIVFVVFAVFVVFVVVWQSVWNCSCLKFLSWQWLLTKGECRAAWAAKKRQWWQLLYWQNLPSLFLLIPIPKVWYFQQVQIVSHVCPSLNDLWSERYLLNWCTFHFSFVLLVYLSKHSASIIPFWQRAFLSKGCEWGRAALQLP